VQILGHVVCSQQYFAGDYADCISYASWMELDTLNAFLDWMAAAGQPGGAPAGANFKTVRQVIGPNLAADTTPPVTTIACNGAPCTTATSAPGVTVALTATDAGSGVERTVYTTDGSDPTTSATARRYTGPFTLSATSTVRYLSADVAMNAETAKSQRITIDRTAPVTTLTCNAAACSTGWYRAPVTVAMTATDTGGVGVDSIHYTTDGSTPSLTSPLYTTPFPVTQTTTVLYASWDRAGNREATKTRLIRIDAAAPTVSITVPSTGASIRRGARQTVSASAVDVGTGTGAASGIARVAWYLDGSTTALATDTSNPYSFTWRPSAVALGVHTLTAIATDAAGNTRTSAPITVTITA
jgi:Bacterial Ig domain/Chitobiase/beta-hexosaminidase C-terminal domain